jgi:dTDP-4-amino-4,6-dideoxygalactose transaminase
VLLASDEWVIVEDVAFLDLGARYRGLRSELDKAIAGVLDRGQFVLGPQVREFEEAFAASVAVQHGIAVASGTDALHLALVACGIGPGDEVITVSFTSGATVAAIAMTGAKPVFVEIGSDSMTMDPAAVAESISPRTKAVVPVHLYGRPADLGAILSICRPRGIRVVEDCAQAHGATCDGIPVGGIGDVGCFSFYPTKNLGAFGDGGFIATNDPELGERVRMLRQYGWRERDRSEIRGFNSRLDEVQAAILRVMLPHVPAWTTRRRLLADEYRRQLSDMPVSLQDRPESDTHAYHLFVIRTANRDQLRAFLRSEGIATMVHYPIPVHLQPAYADISHGVGSLPITEAHSHQIVSLPLYPEMPRAAIGRVTDAVGRFFRG